MLNLVAQLPGYSVHSGLRRAIEVNQAGARTAFLHNNTPVGCDQRVGFTTEHATSESTKVIYLYPWEVLLDQ